ncbi:MAG: Gfo/Idh/MocA family oxidoreductase [Prochlorococcus marinus XMU1428]|nr:Gfo/Idh/MocA family oxidoreductase [Prochlorococcus marinus XMU1428]
MSSQNISLETGPSSDWNSVCLIGLGEHAINKLLPKLRIRYKKNISVVSSKNIDIKSIHSKFTSLDEAIEKLKENTLYVIATPPSTHYYLSKKLLSKGKDILIEKPSFLKSNEFDILRKIAYKKKLVLAEMMMYLENDIVKNSIYRIKKNIKSVKLINLTFTIPSNPKNTFRNQKFFANSVIADIGCYPLNFLAYLDLPMNSISINKVNINNPKFSMYEIKNNKMPEIFINIGCCGIYENCLRVDFCNHNSLEISPFFYGLEGLRNEITINKTLFNLKKKEESNCFQKLFDRSRENWLKNQEFRFNKMSKVIDLFEKFSIDYERV